MSVYNFSQLKENGEKIKDWFKKEIVSLRTGRATPALVENLVVEAYSSRSPLQHVAAINVEDAKTIRITPWDTTVLKSIEQAIMESSLGVQPIADGQSIRISLPTLTEDRRKMLSKTVAEKLEEARISIRKERDEVWKDIQAKEKDGELTEDDKFSLKEEMQKNIDTIMIELEGIAKKKEEEIMSQ